MTLFGGSSPKQGLYQVMRSLEWALVQCLYIKLEMGTQTHAGRHQGRTEGEVRLLLLQAKEPQGRSLHTRSGERPGAHAPSWPQEEVALPAPGSWAPSLQAVRQYVSVV